MEATLTFWRPQRSRAAGDPSPKPGESSVWTDIGRLDYRVTLSGPDRGNCPKSAYRESDRNLASQLRTPMGEASSRTRHWISRRAERTR